MDGCADNLLAPLYMGVQCSCGVQKVHISRNKLNLDYRRISGGQIKASILDELVRWVFPFPKKVPSPSYWPFLKSIWSVHLILHCYALYPDFFSTILSCSPTSLTPAIFRSFISLCSGLLQMPLDIFFSLIHNKNLPLIERSCRQFLYHTPSQKFPVLWLDSRLAKNALMSKH